MALRTKIFFWLLFSLPAILMTIGFLLGSGPAHELLHPSGEMSIRLMIGAMLPGPLVAYFGPTRFLRGWMALRRNLGVIAFVYALLHLLFYLVDKRTLPAVIAELPEPAIWTGWFGILLMLIPAAISFDAAVRALGRRWKRLQQVSYAALVLSIAHWVLLEFHWAPALIHLLPLVVAWGLRAAARNGHGRKARRLSPQ